MHTTVIKNNIDIDNQGPGPGPQLRGEQRAAPPKQKFRPPQTAQHVHSNSPCPCGIFKMVTFFVGDQKRTRKKLDRVGTMTFFFFLRLTEN